MTSSNDGPAGADGHNAHSRHTPPPGPTPGPTPGQTSGAHTGGSSRPDGHATGDKLFAWIRSTGISRTEDGWAGGVVGALSAKLGWDAVLLRGLTVVALILFFSPTLLFYGLAWLVIPDRKGIIHGQEALRGTYSSGFWGGAVLAVVGALNVFTPNLAGPFAVLINIAVIGVVIWVVWLLIQRGRTTTGNSSQAGADSAPGAAEGPDPGHGPDAGPGATPGRADGRPAWYPHHTDDDAGASSTDRAHTHSAHASAHQPPAGYHSASNPHSGGASRAATRTTAPHGYSAYTAEDDTDTAASHRSSLLNWGLVLLAIPVIVGAITLTRGTGLPTVTVALLGLAGVVILLGLIQLVSALRGRSGRPGLLATLTVIMMVLFAGTGFGASDTPPQVFGNYETSEDQVNSAFSNVTVDLTHLPQQFASEAGVPVDELEPFVHTVTLNAAFNNSTVVVPDGVTVEINNGQALGNLSVETQEFSRDTGGISGSSFTVPGDEDVPHRIVLDLNSAFNNITVYDATTFAEEEL